MVFIDTNGFDRQALPSSTTFAANSWVKCAAWCLNVTPLEKKKQWAVPRRIWVEDQDYHIVRFNGGLRRQRALQLVLPA